MVDGKDIVTAAIAGAGLCLSIFNTIQATIRNRVRIKVLPKSAVRRGDGILRSLTEYPPGAMMFCIEVVNCSAFPITIDEVGFTIHNSKKRVASPVPLLIDGDTKWPARLEPQTSVCTYIDISEIRHDVKKAFATTQSGITRYGTSPALDGLREALAKL